MRHDGIRNRSQCDSAERRDPLRSSLLLGALVGIWLAACSGRDVAFVGDPLSGDPRIALITLDVCECDSCRVAIDDPESGEQVFNMTFNMIDPLFPPPTVVADACYNKAMIRITVECGICQPPGPCTATATLALDDDSGNPIGQAPSATCTALAGPATSCGATELPDISMNTLVNANCPM